MVNEFWSSSGKINMHKNKFKWFKDLNIRPETKKLLEENLSNVLFDFGLSNFFFFFGSFSSGKVNKSKNKQINKLDYIKLKGFCKAKETINKMKGYLLREKVFANNISDKGLISKYTKNSYNSTLINKQPNFKKNGQKIRINIFPKKIYKWPTDPWEDV